MMTHLTNDPSFWLAFWALVGMVFTAAASLLGLVIAWAKAKTAQLEAQSATGKADVVAVGQGAQQQTLVQHTAAIAALQATGVGRQATEPAVVPAAPLVAPHAPVGPPS